MTKRGLALAGLALAALAAAPAAGPAEAAPASRASGSATFADPVGDSGPGPDITAVTVSNDDLGMIIFRVDIPNRPVLAPGFTLRIYLDTDNDPTTGDPAKSGTEHAIVALGDLAVLLDRGSGSELTFDFRPTVTSTFSNGVTVTASTGDIDEARSFNFWIEVTDDFTDETNHDAAPDVATWSYAVALAPLRLAVGRFVAVPARGPVAAKRFAIDMSVVLRNSKTTLSLKDEQVSCRARLAGKPIRVLELAIRRRAAECSWRVPKSARGKRMKGSVAVTVRGARISRSFSYLVR